MGRCVLLFLLAFVFLLLSMNRMVNVYDEALILVGATRVAGGEIPHRDFYANYGPAQFYALAFLFKLFSPSVLVERIWDTLIRSAIVICVFLIVERAASRREAILAYGVCLVWISFFAFYGFPMFPALLFSLISALCLIPIFEGRRHLLLLLAAGGSVGLTALFRYDVGFFALASESVVMGTYGLTRPLDLSSKMQALMRIFLPYCVGLILVFLPVAAAFLIYAPFQDFFFDLVYFPSQYYAKTRSLPFPSLFDLAADRVQIVIYLPVAVCVATLMVVIQRSRSGRQDCTSESARNGPSSAHQWTQILLGAISMAFYMKGLVRVSPIHMALSIIPSLTLLAIIAERRSNCGKITAAGIWFSICMIAIPTASALKRVAGETKNNIIWAMKSDTWKTSAPEHQAEVASCRPPQGFERIACFVLAQKRIDAIRYLQARVSKNGYVFVGLIHHDKTFANDIAFYFASKLRPVTKWHQFDPGLQTMERIQNIMVSELRDKKPRYVVLESEWDDIKEPNDSSVSSGVTILDDYIESCYRPVATFETITVLESKGDEMLGSVGAKICPSAVVK